MSMSVVLIDDDDDLRDAIADALTAYGHQVETFGEAGAALERLRAGLAPRLILLDLMMPGMTGWQFRELQRADPMLAQIPVVVLTARTVPEDRDTPPLGPIEVLHKPFPLERLLDVIARYES
jgi:CheY-like chemotaxis protein